MKRHFASLTTPAGEPVFWFGSNFWSRAGGPFMWKSYDHDLVRTELQTMRDHGMPVTRTFLFWPHFHPEPYRLDEELLGHYARFLDLHSELGMQTIPTFIVGNMSGENWSPPWRGDRDLYQDVWLVARQAWFIEQAVRRFAEHPAIAGWLITNEMPIYGGESSRDAVTSWGIIMTNAVRAGGGTQPVSLGDGAWGIEITGHDNGYWLDDQKAFIDFVGPHTYRMDDDPVREHYSAAWQVDLATTFGLPVVLEEFGVSSAYASDDNAADYYRQTLHNSLLAGATGWVTWNNSDYENLAHQDPYRHHAFEMYFGLTDSEGVPKKQLLEVKKFADTLDRIGLRGLTRRDTGVALVIPSHFDHLYPREVESDRLAMYRSLRQSWISARHADAPAGLMRETDGIVQGSKLYLAPSLKQLLSPSFGELEEIARAGATVYVSYFGGDHQRQRGPWYRSMNSFFGVTHQLRYGLVDRIDSDSVELRFVEGLGSIAAGTTLSFPVAGNEHSRGYLPVEPDGARVIARDSEGRPALLQRSVGSGSIILCTMPLEYFAALSPDANPGDLPALYAALADHAGVERPIVVDDPWVATDVLEREGERFAWIVNGSHEARSVAVSSSATTLDGDAVTRVDLAAYGVEVVRLLD